MPPSVVDGRRYYFISVNGTTYDLSLSHATVPNEILMAFGVTPTIRENDLPDWAKTFISLLKPYWQEGQRHDLALVLAGWLLK